MTTHEDALSKAGDKLALEDRRDLLNRRALLELVMAEADKIFKADPTDSLADFRSDKAEDFDPRLTVLEQYELINLALANLPDSPPPQAVGLEAGLAILRTFKQGENNA